MTPESAKQNINARQARAFRAFIFIVSSGLQGGDAVSQGL